MNPAGKRILLWSVIVVVVAAGLVWALRPQAVPVDYVVLEPQSMQVLLNAEGETRVHDVFVLSAPLAGRMRRIEAHVGDPVVANDTVLARIEPGDPTFLDVRGEAAARAAVKAATSAKALAQAEVERVQAELEFARSDYQRIKNLFGQGTVTRRELEAAERAYRTSRAALATAQAGLEVRSFELEQAQAQLMPPSAAKRDDDCACIDITAPVDGAILAIVNPSERMVASGDALIEIGDAHDLEIVADYLSSEAVRIEAGQQAIIEHWGGAGPLQGQVRRVEPSGFTKVSALGIDEQRVNVIIDITSPRSQWTRLGHGFQVETNVVVWARDDALVVPLTALFRDGDAWSVFVDDDGVASRRSITVGHRNGIVAEIREGLEEGVRVIVHPSDEVREGVRVAGRVWS
jgi:HlyD family secretion protein